MSVRVAVSEASDPEACAAQLRTSLDGFEARFVAFFATPSLDPTRLGAAMHRRFGDVPSLGCTTAGELGSGKMRQGSVVLMALDGDTVHDARVAVVGDANDPASVKHALQAIGGGDQPVSHLDPERHVGLVLHDGLQAAEERVMSWLCEFTNVPFVGGSAGDGLKFENTTTFVNFEPQSGTSVLAMLEPTRPYRILKTQSFRVLDQVLEATEVREATRTVVAFNGEPAAEEYARALGVTLSEAPSHFLRHPVGALVDGGEPFVRGLQRISGTDIVLFCHIVQGTRVHLLEAENAVEGTRRDLDAALAAMPSCAGIINFDCVERRGALEQEGRLESYGAVFERVPTIGFSTYGESYIGHINQTATMLLLG